MITFTSSLPIIRHYWVEIGLDLKLALSHWFLISFSIYLAILGGVQWDKVCNPVADRPGIITQISPAPWAPIVLFSGLDRVISPW